MVDIHTHILPDMDDGAQTTEESLQLLEILKSQGVTDVIATPHFYPQIDNTYDFKSSLKTSYTNLRNSLEDKSLPNIHLGCELLYYEGIGNSESLNQFCLLNSSYLLLELTGEEKLKKLFEDLILLKEKNIIPIIAHIERYYGAKNYRKLLKFVKSEKILAQINASAVLDKTSYKIIKKLIKKGIITFIATDSHSVDARPPKMSEALAILKDEFGDEYVNFLIENGSQLLNEIIGDYND